jgi:alkylation response protein AidB-like acyl-CoA dehydrogenase
VNFAFDDDQLEFRSQFRAFLDRECAASDVRAAFELAADSRAPDRERWMKLASIGVLGITVPESFGGLGLGMVDLVGLLEDAGRAGLPEPLAETSGIVVPLLAEIARSSSGGGSPVGGGGGGGSSPVGGDGSAGGASEIVAGEWLKRIANGEDFVAVVPVLGSPSPWIDGADLVVIVDGERVVATRSDGLDAEPVRCLDSTRRLGIVADPVAWPPGSIVISGPEAEGLLIGVRRRGAVATAAVLLGVADRMISMACDHARDRQQFGRPIGSFQAVKHQLATAFVHLEMARPVVYAAAWSIDQGGDGSGPVGSGPEGSGPVGSASVGSGPEGSGPVESGSVERDCSMAKAVASEAAVEAARVALQVHGAIGYTWEHDLHFWMKRAWVLASSWGDPGFHFAKVLATLTNTD